MSGSRQRTWSFLTLVCCAPWLAGFVCDEQAGFKKITDEPGFGDPWNKYSWSIAEFGGQIYVGTVNLGFVLDDAVEVASLAADPATWEGGFVDGLLAIWESGQQTAQTDGGEIWCYNPADESWTKVFDMEQIGVGAIGFRNLAVYKGALFAGTANINRGAEVWSSGDGQNWSVSLQLGDDNRSVRGMAVVGDCLYAGTNNFESGAELWRFDGAEWVLIHVFEDVPGIGELTEMDDLLYIGTWDVRGFELYRYDGQDLELLVSTVKDWPRAVARWDGAVMSMHPFKGKLYLGTANPIFGFAMYAYDPTTGQMEQIGCRGFGWPSNAYAWRLEEHRGRLYMGTWATGTKGPPPAFDRSLQLWSSEDGHNWKLEAPFGLGGIKHYGVRALLSTGDRLYVGTANNLYTGHGTEVWIRDDSR